MGATTIEALLDQYDQGNEDARIAAWWALKDARGHAELIVARMARILDGGNEPERKVVGAAGLLMSLGPEAIGAADSLLRKLETLPSDEGTAGFFLTVLGAIGVPPDQIARSFKKTLLRKSGAKYASPTFSLGLFRYDRQGRWSPQVLAVALESSDDSVRETAAREVGLHGERAAPALLPLLAALKHDFPLGRKTKDAAASMLEMYWGPPAIAGLNQPRSGGWSLGERAFLEYRNSYLWAISRIGPSAKEALSEVIEIATSGHVALRPDAIRTAAMIDSGAPVVLKIATGALGDSNPLMRLAGEDAIRFLGPRASAARAALVNLLSTARAYELRAIWLALEAIGWDAKPDTAGLIAALNNPKPDSSSIEAAHRLGLVPEPSPSVVASLQEGLESKEPRVVCLSALSLGRLAPRSEAAIPALIAALKAFELAEEMDIWEATKAAYVIEALGRMGPTAAAALPTMTKIISGIEKRYWGVLVVSGLNQRLIARAYCMIQWPSYALSASIVPDADTNADPVWFADWHLDPPNPGCVLWQHQALPTLVWMEYGEIPVLHADWSTVYRNGFDDSVLLCLERVEKGVLALGLLDWQRAIAWARQKETETRPAELYALKARMRPADLDVVRNLDLDFRVQDFREKGYYRWRGGFSVPNPWRRAGK